MNIFYKVPPKRTTFFGLLPKETLAENRESVFENIMKNLDASNALLQNLEQTGEHKVLTDEQKRILRVIKDKFSFKLKQGYFDLKIPRTELINFKINLDKNERQLLIDSIHFELQGKMFGKEQETETLEKLSEIYHSLILTINFDFCKGFLTYEKSIKVAMLLSCRNATGDLDNVRRSIHKNNPNNIPITVTHTIFCSSKPEDSSENPQKIVDEELKLAWLDTDVFFVFGTMDFPSWLGDFIYKMQQEHGKGIVICSHATCDDSRGIVGEIEKELPILKGSEILDDGDKKMVRKLRKIEKQAVVIDEQERNPILYNVEEFYGGSSSIRDRISVLEPKNDYEKINVLACWDDIQKTPLIVTKEYVNPNVEVEEVQQQKQEEKAEDKIEEKTEKTEEIVEEKEEKPEEVQKPIEEVQQQKQEKAEEKIEEKTEKTEEKIEEKTEKTEEKTEEIAEKIDEETKEQPVEDKKVEENAEMQKSDEKTAEETEKTEEKEEKPEEVQKPIEEAPKIEEKLKSLVKKNLGNFVILNFFPIHDHAGTDGALWIQGTDGDKILQNSIIWVAKAFPFQKKNKLSI